MAPNGPSDAPLRSDLSFLYRMHRPASPDGLTLVLLHGSGVNETTVLPFGARIDPDAVLIAPRGRVIQDGEQRWFRKITPVSFEQASVVSEARAFARFVGGLKAAHGVEPAQTLFVGYSNGANLIAALMLLNPGLILRAALLRAMPVMEQPPSADLSGAAILVLGGASDRTYASFTPELARLLEENGASVEQRMVACGHEFGDPDVRAIRNWLAGSRPAGSPAEAA